jgi:hypothetical protein
MRLTTAKMAIFAGGDLLITACAEGLYKGPIKRIVVDEKGKITIELEWTARNNGTIASPVLEWTSADNKLIVAESYTFSWHSSGSIVMDVAHTNQVLVFSQRGRDSIDKNRVAGL